MYPQGILMELGVRLGAGPLTWEDDSCRLALDDHAVMVIDHRPTEATLWVRLPMALPEGDEAALDQLLEELLALGFAGERTGGASIAIDTEEERLEVCRRLPLAALDAAGLERCIAQVHGIGKELVRSAGLRLITPAEI